MNTPSENPYASPRTLSEPVTQGVYFGSYLQDGRVISTLGGKPDLESPPEVVRESYRNRPMAELLNRHRQR